MGVFVCMIPVMYLDRHEMFHPVSQQLHFFSKVTFSGEVSGPTTYCRLKTSKHEREQILVSPFSLGFHARNNGSTLYPNPDPNRWSVRPPHVTIEVQTRFFLDQFADIGPVTWLESLTLERNKNVRVYSTMCRG